MTLTNAPSSSVPAHKQLIPYSQGAAKGDLTLSALARMCEAQI